MLRVLFLVLVITFSYANETINLQLKWKHSFQFAGFYMAKEKGFYKDVGLDVNIIENSNNISVVKKVLSNKNYYGIMDSSLFYWALNGADIKLLMPILENSPIALITTDETVKQLNDIKNKHIATEKNSIKNPSILAMLKSKNIDYKKLKLSDESYNRSDILNKNYIFSIYDTDELFTIQKSGVKYKIFRPSDYGFDFYGDILFTSQQEVRNHPKRVQEMIDATQKGWEYAYRHIYETIKVILKKYNTQNFSYKKLKNESDRLKKYMSSNFEFKDAEIKRINDIFFLLGMATENREINTYIYKRLNLTQKERNFLNSHIIRCETTSSWTPFNSQKNGKPYGLAIDYWNIIKKKLNIKSKCIIKDSWSGVLQDIKEKKVDLTLATDITPQRKKYALFSKPYITFPVVIATKNDVGFIPNISTLRDKKIAVGKNYTVEEFIKRDFPYMNIKRVKDTDAALKLLNRGEVFAVIDILPVIAYKLGQYKFTNLKISGKTPWNFNVRIMIRDDYKELLKAINSAIDSIKRDEKIKINNKWAAVRYDKGYGKEAIFGISLIYIFIILIILGWVFHLKNEIAKRRKLEKELERLATTDRLTNIFNRYKMDISLDRHVEIAKRYNRPLSIIYFDIDKFKNINDTYGHKIGDQVLIELSKLVQSKIRKSDIFGRWGGEEFLIISPETKKSEAIELAQKLKNIIQDYKFPKIKGLTCSFGVATFKDGDNTQKIIVRVDKRLYKAKKGGRNRVEFT